MRIGSINPIKRMIQMAHDYDARSFIGWQLRQYRICPVMFKIWIVTFYAFSGHKLYGPTGIGVLVG